jgi:hypothetical protein
MVQDPIFDILEIIDGFKSKYFGFVDSWNWWYNLLENSSIGTDIVSKEDRDVFTINKGSREVNK